VVFEVLKAVTKGILSSSYKRFGGISCLHIQRRRVSFGSKGTESADIAYSILPLEVCYVTFDVLMAVTIRIIVSWEDTISP
jgi:hypothetical protein